MDVLKSKKTEKFGAAYGAECLMPTFVGITSGIFMEVQVAIIHAFDGIGSFNY
jgi:hypothetical protein